VSGTVITGQTQAAAAPTRSDRRKARTESAILGAAEACFIERGFHGVTMEEIAERADVAVGSIYVHFHNKEGLYLALLERAIEIEERYLDEALRQSLPLIAAAQAYLSFYLDHPGYYRMLNFPPFASDPVRASSAGQRLAERVEAQVVRLAACIQERIDMEILTPMDARRAAEFFHGAFSGVIALNMRGDQLRLEESELRAVMEEGLRIIGEGILAQAMRDEEGRSAPLHIIEAEQRLGDRGSDPQV
jgi:TetR/AcrR family transcriptional regulator